MRQGQATIFDDAGRRNADSAYISLRHDAAGGMWMKKVYETPTLVRGVQLQSVTAGVVGSQIN
jgi:hypothetical protein